MDAHLIFLEAELQNIRRVDAVHLAFINIHRPNAVFKNVVGNCAANPIRLGVTQLRKG
jgi:hypothetical protein